MQFIVSFIHTKIDRMRIKSDARYWTDRYRESATGWDIGGPSTPIAEYIDQLDDKSLRILVPGAGYGHEVVYLAEQGFKHVTVVDISPLPIDHLTQRVGEANFNLLMGDFFDHGGQYDLILEQTFFCAIDPSLRGDYVRHCHDLLTDGGKVVGVLFDTDFGGRPGPPHGGSAEEYRALFSKKFSAVEVLPCHNSIPPRSGKEAWLNAIK